MSQVHKFLDVDEKVVAYVNGLLDGAESESMKALREETEDFDHGEMQAPISQLRVIISIMQMTGARRVLEIGTFRGMTAARLAQALPRDVIGAKVVTLEKDLRYVDELKDRWQKLNVADKVELRSGPAIESLDTLIDQVEQDGYFDLVFIDADKENYKNYVERSLRLVRSRGVILIDNTLWGGEVARETEDSNIVRNIKNFNAWVFEKFGTSASAVPAWDGMTIIVKEWQ